LKSTRGRGRIPLGERPENDPKSAQKRARDRPLEAGSKLLRDDAGRDPARLVGGVGGYLWFLALYDALFALLAWALFEYVVAER